MSFFSTDVIAKEQLHGVVGAPVIPPAVPAPYPTAELPVPSGIPRKKPSPLSIIITPDGQILLNLDIQKRRN
jgi:hypothetical protein